MRGVIVLDIGKVRVVGGVVEIDRRLGIVSRDDRILERNVVGRFAPVPVVAIGTDRHDRATGRERAHARIKAILEPALRGDASGRAGIVMLVIGHQQHVIDDMGVVGVRQVLIIERNGQHDDPSMRQEGLRKLLEEFLDRAMVSGRDLLEIDRHALQLVGADKLHDLLHERIAIALVGEALR